MSRRLQSTYLLVCVVHLHVVRRLCEVSSVAGVIFAAYIIALVNAQVLPQEGTAQASYFKVTVCNRKPSGPNKTGCLD